jgi:hypothetical protein
MNHGNEIMIWYALATMSLLCLLGCCQGCQISMEFMVGVLDHGMAHGMALLLHNFIYNASTVITSFIYEHLSRAQAVLCLVIGEQWFSVFLGWRFHLGTLGQTIRQSLATLMQRACFDNSTSACCVRPLLRPALLLLSNEHYFCWRQ